MDDSSSQRVRVLVVDDEAKLAELLRLELDIEGYDVDVANDGASGLVMARKEPAPDLIVLDWNLPDFSGVDICQRIRRGGVTTPILMLTGHDDIADRVTALDAGVDDYLVKPFGMRELVARCRALLRRCQPPVRSEPAAGDIVRHDNLCLFAQECRITRDQNDLNLSPKEYRILELFIRNPKRVWSRDQLLEKVWGIDFVGDTKTVDVHIRWLREKIEDEPSSPKHIRTVRGFGYRFG